MSHTTTRRRWPAGSAVTALSSATDCGDSLPSTTAAGGPTSTESRSLPAADVPTETTPHTPAAPER